MGSVTKNNPFTSGIESDHEMNLETAKRLEADAKYQAMQRRRMADKLASEQIVSVATSGITLEGSASQVIHQDRVDAEIEAMNMIYSGKYQAAEMRRRSQAQRKQAYMGLGMQALSFGASRGMFKSSGASSVNTGEGMIGSSHSGISNSGNIA